MSTTVYKLTDKNIRTYNLAQWTLGEWKETSGEGELCSKGWLHCSSDPLLAILLNSIHGDFENPRLFRAEAEGIRRDDRGLKQGYTRMRIVEEIAVPQITIEQKVIFAILCVKKVCKNKEWNEWADKWLSGEDRNSADAARAACAAADAAARAADAAAACAARAAADADAAARAAADADAAARAAAYAARASACSADAAARAAAYAARASACSADAARAAYSTNTNQLDLIAIAKEACS